MSRVRVCLLLCVTASCAVACSRKSEEHSSGASTNAKTLLVGDSQCHPGEPSRVQMNADITQAAARHPDLKLVFKDAQNDSLRQRAQVQELLAQGIRLPIISPTEAAPLGKPVAEVYRQGVPVIVLGRALEGDAYTTFIGADNRRIGRKSWKSAVASHWRRRSDRMDQADSCGRRGSQARYTGHAPLHSRKRCEWR